MTNRMAQIKAIDKRNEKKLLKTNPNLDDESGIYFLTRTDPETGIRFSYVGQALHIKQRMLGHLRGYQHIDLSIRKHGLYSEDRPGGWKINFKHYPPNKLNDMERYYIILYAKQGYQSRNKDTGGGKGKTGLGGRKPPRTYSEGKLEGKRQLAIEICKLMENYLDISIREGTEGRGATQAVEKFFNLIDPYNYWVKR